VYVESVESTEPADKLDGIDGDGLAPSQHGLNGARPLAQNQEHQLVACTHELISKKRSFLGGLLQGKGACRTPGANAVEACTHAHGLAHASAIDLADRQPPPRPVGTSKL
jgi:hypothetical protein